MRLFDLIWYVEVRISRSISESPLDFEITRVDCICSSFFLLLVPSEDCTSWLWHVLGISTYIFDIQRNATKPHKERTARLSRWILFKHKYKIRASSIRSSSISPTRLARETQYAQSSDISCLHMTIRQLQTLDRKCKQQRAPATETW